MPSYSPGSIAEYAVAQMMALAKNTHMSYVMTKKADFDITSLQCLLMENKTVGVIGTGLIGECETRCRLVFIRLIKNGLPVRALLFVLMNYYCSIRLEMGTLIK